jgi:hypothetical protein
MIEKLARSGERAHLLGAGGIGFGVVPLQALHLFSRDGAARLAEERVQEEPAAHPDSSMDAPDRELDAGALEGVPPGEDVLVDAVHERPVEVEEKGGGGPLAHDPPYLALTVFAGLL